MLGDRQSLIGKWGGILFQGLIVGSLFYDLPKTSAGVFQRGGVLFFMLLFNALLALAELTSAFTSRPILLKHKTFSFYRPSAYAIAQVLIDLPLVAVQVCPILVSIFATRSQHCGEVVHSAAISSPLEPVHGHSIALSNDLIATRSPSTGT